jgi:O-antigen/teichoic acid export membrane protein
MSSPEDPAAQPVSLSTAAVPTTAASVARGGIWEIASSVIPQMYVVVSSIFVARYLGPAGVGRIALIAFVVFTTGTFLSLGMPLALLRYIAELVGARKLAEARGLYQWAWRVEGIAAAVAFAILVVIAALGATPRAAWALGGLMAAGIVMNSVQSSFLRGLLRWREARIAGLVSGLVSVFAKVAILVAGGGITALFVVDAVITLANVVATQIFTRGVARQMPPPAVKGLPIRPVLRFAGISSVTIFVQLIVYQRTEVFFLAHYATDAEIAIYTIPLSVVTALMLLPRAIGSALAPAIATLWGAGEIERIRSGFSRAIRISLVITIVLTAFAVTLMPRAIHLVYGPGFGRAGPIVVILVAMLPFVPLGLLSSSLLQGVGRQIVLMVMNVIAAVVDIGLDFALIPRYGAVGAAIANAAAQLLSSIPVALHAARVLGGITLHVGAMARAVLATAVAASCTAIVVHAVAGVAGLALGLVAFALACLLAGLVLRPIAAEDATWIDHVAGTWLHGLIGLACRALTARPLPPREGEA